MSRYDRYPPQTYLTQCFSYDSETGSLVWKVRPREHFNTEHAWKTANSRNAGKCAGTTSTDNYVQVCLTIGDDKRRYLVHIIAYILITGEPPTKEIDHRNRVKSYNSWDNLRPATRSQNMFNTLVSSSNTSGVKGVYYASQATKWVATITKEGQLIYLGRFDTFDEAVKVRREAEQQLFGEFAPSDTLNDSTSTQILENST